MDFMLNRQKTKRESFKYFKANGGPNRPRGRDKEGAKINKI